MVLKPKIEATAGSGLEMLEIALRNPDHFGKTMGEVMSGAAAADARSSPCARATRTSRPSHGHIVAENDIVLVVGPTKEVLEQARKASATRRPGACVKDRSDLDYLRVFASQAERRRPDDRRPRAAREEGRRRRPGPPRRRQHPAAARPRARVRRPRRPARRTATTSPRSASSSATRSRARPSSATSRSAWAWRSASCSARSSSRCR